MNAEETTKCNQEYHNRLEKHFPNITQGGNRTFAGVLFDKLFDFDKNQKSIGIFNPEWKKGTMKQYMDIFCDHLLPNLPDEKPIDEYTLEDFDATLALIKSKNTYGAATMGKYELLVWRVCHAAYTDGYCQDILWGTHYHRGSMTKPKESEEKTEKLLRTRKSFSESEEIQVRNALLQDPTDMPGEQIGLLIMFLTGLRNNEACGLSFGDLHSLFEYPSTWTLWIYQTTDGKTNILKNSGKTKNANRILPILDILQSFLQQRLDFVRTQVGEDIMDYPVACRGKNFKIRCSSGDMSAAGRQLFKTINMDARRVIYLDEFVQEGYSRGVIEEKDATTYLFRRNFATHLKNLGFSMGQAQYYIGHDVEGPNETRNGFTGEPQLQKIKELLRYHPMEQHTQDIPTTVVTGYAQTKPKDISHTFQLCAASASTTFLITASAITPTDEIEVRISSDSIFRGEILKI